VSPVADQIQPRPFAFATHVLPAAAYASAIFYSGLIRIGALPEVGFVASDKLLHALAFAGLALLIARAVHWLRPQLSFPKKLLHGAAGSSFLGFLLEVCQAFTTYRSADVWDWLADTVGALLAAALLFLLFSRSSRRAHG